MTRVPPDPELLVRFLAQRRELGWDGWILEGISRDRALELAREAGTASRRPARDPEAFRAAVGSGGPPPPDAPPSRPSPAGRADVSAPPPPSDPQADLPHDHRALRDIALGCTRCRLAGGRTQVVFSDGTPEARVMVVGEAPGAEEDRTGLPFVGRAGKLLDLLLASVGLSREESVYICNVIKCRPPENRNPRPDEIEACAPYLRRQIELVRPEAILAVGTFAARLLTDRDIPLGRLRGQIHSYEGVPLVVTYHPAALLRNSTWTRSTWDDLQLLRQILDDGAP